MAQHDYNIANQSGSAFRADLNNALAAVASQNSGSSEPATTFAYMLWADTTAGKLKIRNGANNAWIEIGTLADAGLGILNAVPLGTVSAPGLAFAGDANTGIYSPTTDQIAFTTGGVQRLNITTAALLPTLPLRGSDGTAANPAYSFSGDTDTGIYRVGANVLSIATGGSDRLVLGASGQLGIAGANYGTSGQVLTSAGSGAAPAWSNPAFVSPTNGFNFRNRIINGDMRIDQRNAGAAVTPAGVETYTVDRFSYIGTQASKFTFQQNAGSVTPPTGFTNYLGFTVASAVASPAAGDQFAVYHKIEGLNCSDLAFGSASASAVTVSFWVRSSLTGTFSGGLVNSAGNRSYVFNYTIGSANTWEQKTVTIAGDITGTWLTTNGVGIQLRLDLGSGSNQDGTASAWQAADKMRTSGSVRVVSTAGATFYITGVQLEAGSVASPFERRDYGRELMMCQRYYQQTASMTLYASYVSTNTWRVPIYYKTDMRASPTFAVTQSSGGGIVVSEGGTNSGITVGTNSSATASTFSAFTATAEL